MSKIRGHRFGLMFIFMLVGLSGGAGPSAAMGPAADSPLYAPADRIGTIMDAEICEASGMAASLRTDDLLWLINDSGNPADLFAVGHDGQTRAKFPIADVPNCDWEDLASFSLNQTPYLLIADIGDNLAGRGRCSLFVVKEPILSEAPETPKRALPVEWSIYFTYPTGPRDCEAVAVDVQGQRILLLSKRDRPPLLFELPLKPSPQNDSPVLATAIGPMTTIPPPTEEDLQRPYGFSWSRPTAMDLSADGRRLVVLTYKHAYAFTRSPGQAWGNVIQTPPTVIPLPHPDTGLLPIREALCLHPQTGTLFVTGEKIPAPVFRLAPLREPR